MNRAASWIAVTAILGLVGLAIVLASTLPELTLTEGTPFDGRASLAKEAHGEAIARAGATRPFIQFLAYAPLAIVLVAALLYAWSMRHRGSDEETGPPRRRTRWGAVIVMLLIIPVLFLTRDRMARTLEEEAPVAETEEQTTAEERELVPLPAAIAAGVGDTPRAESHTAARLLEVALAVLATGASVALLVAAWRMRRERPKPPEPEAPALEQAIDGALRGLAQGRDPAGVVIDCYREMMGAFAATSGVNPRALTPREFAASLGSKGLGGEPLDELTSLFELVRYGRRPDDAFAPRALSCMTKLRERLAEIAAAEAAPVATSP